MCYFCNKICCQEIPKIAQSGHTGHKGLIMCKVTLGYESVVMAQLAGLSLLIPEVHGLNPVIGKIL